MNIHRPTLAEIVGQERIVSYLQSLLERPRQEALLFLGSPGVGKTVAAHAFADELAGDDEWKGHWTVPCTELGVDQAKKLFSETLRIRWDSRSGFNCLVLEEMELLSPQCQGYLKAAIDKAGNIFPRNLVIIATSNSVKNISEAVRERFKTFRFDHSDQFMVACQKRLTDIWAHRTTRPMPRAWTTWGISDRRFSMRQAIAELEIELEAA